MTPPKPQCPRCNSRKIAPANREIFKCLSCGAFYDSDPEEGGDYHDTDPCWRLEREERRRERFKSHVHRKRR